MSAAILHPRRDTRDYTTEHVYELQDITRFSTCYRGQTPFLGNGALKTQILGTHIYTRLRSRKLLNERRLDARVLSGFDSAAEVPSDTLLSKDTGKFKSTTFGKRDLGVFNHVLDILSEPANASLAFQYLNASRISATWGKVWRRIRLRGMWSGSEVYTAGKRVFTVYYEFGEGGARFGATGSGYDWTDGAWVVESLNQIWANELPDTVFGTKK
ncbi:uncharacterized protein BDR25DRAFT_355120 [Lindgomyces ingoldianus]|uniref:Uncharacterized protein n=1 Tax=Lindgomyces ingoldianus TaxID=673940 RepID=A0ACB6QVV6_9PLEO|nr:uncharacterized protein BDR25DRAFT_355120 [Lindgomyces ingoldianus]KAF2470635.1 hypothetical protein BDR25DRAFT_355120 [Lindgomyces ingoldianus]